MTRDDGDPQESLALSRTEIGEIDREIISLLRKRLDLALQTGKLKRQLGLPILDPEREAAVIRTAVEAARAEQLPEELVREIFWRILGMSRGAQQEVER
jgi:chorismate mutase / prephenate dehydrogenase